MQCFADRPELRKQKWLEWKAGEANLEGEAPRTSNMSHRSIEIGKSMAT